MVIEKKLKRLCAFRLDAELADRMKSLKEKEGIPESEQVRRALRAWLDKQERRSARRSRK